MTTTAESVLIWATVIYTIFALASLVLQDKVCVRKCVSKITSKPISGPIEDDGSDTTWETTSEATPPSTASSSVIPTPSTVTPHPPATPTLQPSTPSPGAHEIPIPPAHLLQILSRAEFLEEDNHYAHFEIQRLSHAEEQWRGTLHALSTQIEQLTCEREHAYAEHARWRVFATERAQDKANLSAHALHLEERVEGLENDVLYLKGMKETLADMTVQAQVRYSGTKMLLEGRVAELEEENEGLKRELERLREEVQRGKEEEGLGGDEEVGASGDDRPYTAEDWHHMQLDTDWRSIY